MLVNTDMAGKLVRAGAGGPGERAGMGDHGRRKNLDPGVTCVYFDPRRTDCHAAEPARFTYSSDRLTASSHELGVAQRFAALSLHDGRWLVAAAPGIAQPLKVKIAKGQ